MIRGYLLHSRGSGSSGSRLDILIRHWGRRQDGLQTESRMRTRAGALAPQFFLVALLFLLLGGLPGCSNGGFGAVKPEVTIAQGSSTTVIAGQPLTLTATTTGTGPFTFQWYEGGKLISGATSSTYTVQASSVMNGDVFTVEVTNAAGSTSQSTTVTVNTVPSVATAPQSQTVIAGQTATFTVAASGTAPLSYQWYLNGVAISGATSASYTTPATNALGEFNYSVVITNVAGTVTSPVATLTVDPIAPTLSFSAIGTHTYGDSAFGVSASSVSSGAISYHVVSGPAAMSGNMVTLTGSGTVVLGATQVADGLYAAASAEASFVVNTETPSLVFSSIGSHTYGDAPFTVSASSASAGAVTYSVVSGPATITGNTVTLTGAGTVVLSATQAASGDYAAGTAQTSFTVKQETPSLSFGAIASHTYGDAAFAVSATSASTGAVSYSVVSGPATVTGSTVTLTGAGTVVLSASQAADSNYTSATAQTSFTVNAATPDLHFATVADKTYGDAAFAVSATSASTGAVSYSVVSGPAAMAGNTVTLTGAGTVVLGASQAASGNYTAATAQTSFTVNPETPSLLFSTIASHTYGDASFAVSASSASTGTVSYSVVSGPATITGNTVTLTGVGTVVLSATQTANGNYATATVQTSFTVNTATPTLSFATIATHTYGDAAFAVSATSASTGAVSYSVVSGPATIAGNTVTLTGVGTVVLSASQAASGNYAAATAQTSFTVGAATPTLSFATIGTKTLGDSAFTVSATSASTGTVSYSVVSGPATIAGNTVTLSGTTTGTVVLKASQDASSDGDYAATSTTTSFAVNDSTPVISSLTGSTSTPTYGATITLTPSFTGGTAVLGTSGSSSSDVATGVVSGTAYTTAAITAKTVYTLTVTSLGGSTKTTINYTATPGSVTLSAISPAAQTSAPGTITFSSTATGGATNSIKWTVSGGSIDSNGNWSSPDTAGSYTITATSADEPSVSVSTTATISQPVITTQPVSKNVCTGYSASISIGASYATNYTWLKDYAQVGTGSTLSLSNISSSTAGTYSCVVSNDAGSVTSNTALVNVLTPTTLTITSDPASVTVYVTQTATFAVSATGTGTLSYQWYKSTDSGTTFSAISGATSSTYTTAALTAANSGTQYRVTVNDGDCTNTKLTSNAATLTVSGSDTAVPPTIVTQPLGVTASEGGTATFTVVASGAGTLKYQWYRVTYTSSSLATKAGTLISGATSASYTVPSTYTNSSDDGDEYYVVVTNTYGTAVSERAMLAVGNGVLLQVSGQPQTKYIAANSLATFTVTANCSECTPSYAWYYFAPGSTSATLLSNGSVSSGKLNGATISGATTGTLTLSNVPSTASASEYYAVVTATSDGSTQITGTNPVTSSKAGLFVGSLGTIGASGSGKGLCNDTTNSISWALNGTKNGSSSAGTVSGDVPYQNTSACSIEMTDDNATEAAAVYWPTLISTAKFSVSFRVAMSASSDVADGFTLILADPSQGATTSSLGRTGEGLGAADVPGLVLAFDTYQNGNGSGSTSCTDSSNSDNSKCDPIAVPYMAVGQGVGTLWANPWTNVNGYLDTQNSTNYSKTVFGNATHDYVVSVVSGTMTVTMDGYELFTGKVSLPPVAYLGFTASTGGSTESVTLSNMTATVSAP